MKKFLSAVLAAALMLGCTFAVSADYVEPENTDFTEDFEVPEGYDLAIKPCVIEAEPGDEVAVYFDIKFSDAFVAANRTVYACDFEYLFDDSKLEVAHYDWDGNLLSDLTGLVEGDDYYADTDMPFKPNQKDPASGSTAGRKYTPKVPYAMYEKEGGILHFQAVGDIAKPAYHSNESGEYLYVVFKVKEGASGFAQISVNELYTIATIGELNSEGDNVKAKTAFLAGGIQLPGSDEPEVPELKLENTEVLYGHYEEDKTTKYAAAAEFEFDATDVTVEDIKNIGFYYNYVADKTNTPVLESVAIGDVLEHNGKFFVTVSDLDLDTEVPLFAYLILSDDTVVMSSMVSITATAANTEPDVTYHPSNYTE